MKNEHTAINERFVRLVVEKEEEGYRLLGLKEGKSFKEPDNYKEIKASYLKVNDVGFAANKAEFGEYETYIRVIQNIDGGMANITFEPQSDKTEENN